MGRTHKKSKKGGEEEEQLSKQVKQPRTPLYLLKHPAIFQQISFQVQATF
jgi:hypothetical protein